MIVAMEEVMLELCHFSTQEKVDNMMILKI